MLTKSKGNMYGFISHQWNPIGGECKHGCPYCYVKRGMARMSGKYKGEPRLIEKELQVNLGAGKTIFVCSMNDMFGDWIPKEWIDRIVDHCSKYPYNTYLFQSKNPRGFNKILLYNYPPHSIFCTTIETNRLKFPVGKNLWGERVNMFISFPLRRTLTIEPIQDFDLKEMIDIVKQINPEWVSIGADSKHCNLPEPSSEKVRDLITELEKFVKVIQKDNLKRLLEAR